MLKYLFDPNIQFLDTSGAINVGGHLEVYQAYTDDAATTYADISGNAMNPQKIPLDSNGRATVAVDDGKSYRLEVYAEGGLLLWTVQPYMPSGTIVNLPVIVDGTENEIDVSESLSASEKTFTVSLSEIVKKSIGDLDKSLSDETKARKEADKSINDSISAIGDALSTETTERKEADAELAKAIAGKQSPLQDGDNIHIDENSKINVVGRKTLAVESPLTVTKTSTQLILGIRPDAFATADDIASEATERKSADDTLESSIAGKQDGKFTFDPNSSTHSEVMAAIIAGRTIVSGSGSSLATWQGSIIGAIANLFRLYGTEVFHYYYSFGQWALERQSLATVPAMGRLTIPMNGTGTFSYGDWTFAFSVNSIQAAVVNIKNEKATSADIFSESRTYGNTVRLVGQDLSSGKDIVYSGNGDFQSIPARIVMDIRTGSEWIELRIMQFTSGSNLVIDYRIGGANG